MVLGWPFIASAAVGLTLTWVDNSGGEASFIVERGTSTAGPYVLLGQVGRGVVTYVDNSVSIGTTHCYRVAAVNGFGISDYSDPACGRVAGGFAVTVVKDGPGKGTVI